MSATLLIVLVPLAVGFALARAVLADIANEEARTRLERIPFALLDLAARRVPTKQREDLTGEWNAELDHIIARTEGLPLSRLVRGVRFAAGILLRAPDIAGDLSRLRKLGTTAGRIASGALLAAAGLGALAGTLWLAAKNPPAVVIAGQVSVGLSWFTIGVMVAAAKTATPWWWLAPAGLSAGNFAMAAGPNSPAHIGFGVLFGCGVCYLLYKNRQLQRRIKSLKALIDAGDVSAFTREHDLLFPGCTECAEIILTAQMKP